MSKTKDLPGKLQWLNSVQVCLKGLIGTYGLLLAWEGANIVFNPQHTVTTLGLVLNWHFMNILQLTPSLVIFLVAYYLSQPVEQGLRENEAKLFFLNLRKDYTHLKKAIHEEEGRYLLRDLVDDLMKELRDDYDQGKPKEQPKMDNKSPLNVGVTGITSLPWDSTNMSPDVERNDVDSEVDS